MKQSDLRIELKVLADEVRNIVEEAKDSSADFDLDKSETYAYTVGYVRAYLDTVADYLEELERNISESSTDNDLISLLERCKVFIEGVDYSYAKEEGLNLLEDIEATIETSY